MTPEQSVELRSLSTSVLSDALDEASIDGVVTGPRAQRADQGRVVGRAFTARFEPRQKDPGAYRFGGGVGRPLEQVLKGMSRGDMVVIDLGGSIRAAAWGGLASRLAQQRGVQGTMLLGACRDLEEICELGYPVWATASCPRRSRNDFTFGSIQEPIHADGVNISPGDIIVADRTGVVCIPAAELERVLDLARRIEVQETSLLASLQGDTIESWDQM